jgi:hypothetical protein
LCEAASDFDDQGFRLAQFVETVLAAFGAQLIDVLDVYFTTIHQWSPIVDEQKLKLRLQTWPQNVDADFATLVLAIYLVTRWPCTQDPPPSSCQSMDSTLYRATKQVFFLRASQTSSLALLHAGLMLVYYACGHAMPREAHVLLSTSAALARLLGADLERIELDASKDSELFGCAWAINQLDRLVAPGS